MFKAGLHKDISNRLNQNVVLVVSKKKFKVNHNITDTVLHRNKKYLSIVSSK